MWKKSFFASAVLCGAFSLAAEKADPPAPAGNMEELKVIALGRDTVISQTPGGISIADEDAIFQTRPLSLSDLSIRLPGVSKSSDSHWGSEMNIRGLTRNRIVFMVDGQRVNTATDVGVQFGLLLPDDIERIEVLKGPVSEIYGSGSLGGVVNVRTHGASFTETPEIHGGISLSASSNPVGFSSYARLSYSDSRFWMFISGGYRDYDSYKDGGHEEVKHSYMEDDQITLKAGYKWDHANVTEVSFRRYRAVDVGVPGAEGLPGAATRVLLPETSMDTYSLKHIITPGDSFWSESSLQLYYQKIDRDVSIDRFVHPTTAAWPRPNHLRPSATHETYGGRWNNIFEIDHHTILWGLDAWRWEYTGSRIKKVALPAGTFKIIRDIPMADSSQTNLGFYAEDDWKLNDSFTLNIGARADRIWARSDDLYGTSKNKLMEDSEMNDWSWSAHAGLTCTLNDNWSMTLLLSRGNRVPDILDRFKYISLSQGVLYGNADLEPEESYFAEYGIHYKTQNFRTSLSAYINRIDNMVAAKAIPGTINQRMENIDKAFIKGVELEANWKFAQDWETYGFIAWLEGDDIDNDVYLRNNPPMNGLLGLRYNHPSGWWAQLESSWAAEQDHTAPGYDEADAWATFNAQIGYMFETKRIKHSIALSADNLLNAQYTNYLSSIRGNNSALAYQEPGRSFNIAWKMEF